MILEFRDNRYRAWHGGRCEWNFDNTVKTIVNAKQIDTYRVLLIGHNGEDWFVIRKSRWRDHHQERVVRMEKESYMFQYGIRNKLPITCIVPVEKYQIDIVYDNKTTDRVDFESVEIVDLT